jgi:hypothetical protein
VITGIAGFIPFLVHKIIVPRKEKFNKSISNIIIIGNILAGIALIIVGIFENQ